MSSQIQIPPQHGFTSNKIRTLNIDNSQHKFLAGGGGEGGFGSYAYDSFLGKGREYEFRDRWGLAWHPNGEGGKRRKEGGGGGYTFVLSNTRLHALQLT